VYGAIIFDGKGIQEGTITNTTLGGYQFVWGACNWQRYSFGDWTGTTKCLDETYNSKTHPHLRTSAYMPYYTDPIQGCNKTNKAGEDMPISCQNHTLKAWVKNHPEWILYNAGPSTDEFPHCPRDADWPCFVETHDGKLKPAWDSFGDANIPLDITNDDVVEYQFQTFAIPARDAGFDAIAADVFYLHNEPQGCCIFKKGDPSKDENASQLYWQAIHNGEKEDLDFAWAQLKWVKDFRSKLQTLTTHKGHPMELIINFNHREGEYESNSDLMTQLAQAWGGQVDERGFTEWGGNRLFGDAWIDTVTWALDLQELGKPYYIINQNRRLFYTTKPNAKPYLEETGDVWFNPDVRAWSAASYLMLKANASAFNMGGMQECGDETRENMSHAYGCYGMKMDPSWPELSAIGQSIGHPINPRPVELECGEDQKPCGYFYERAYSNGIVVVNAADNKTQYYWLQRNDTCYFDVSRNTTLNQKYGNTYALGPTTGAILVYVKCPLP